jgi:long-chain acyl-CoA synthetase
MTKQVRFPGGGSVFVTGARGLVGSETVRELLRRDESTTIYALSRTPELLPADFARHQRVVPVLGDIAERGLRLRVDARRELAERVDVVIHCAAETRFSMTRDEARISNVDGTLHVLELVSEWTRSPRFCFVSTAFVAGRRTGQIPEDPGSPEPGWVNEYERSKFEAEEHVRASGIAHVICRSSTIVCDTPAGGITQFNAVHRALRVCHRSLVPMLPGTPDAPVDTVPNDYVSRAIVDLSTRPGIDGSTYHLAAGKDALTLGELLDETYAYWSEVAGPRHAPLRPLLTDLDTYRLFEATVLETAEPDLRRVTRALSHFAPQLALPKTFETDRADAALGYRPPPVRAYWRAVLRTLTAWCPEVQGTACERSAA